MPERLFQPADGHRQAVGSHLRLQSRMQQRRLEQLSIGTFFLCPHLYLLQVANGRLGQVLLLGLVHLLPHLLICLTFHSHRYKQQCCHQQDQFTSHTHILTI